MLRCKGFDEDFHDIEWKFIKNAWVPAVTVCSLRLDSVLTKPDAIYIDAVEVDFGGTSNGPYTLTENVPFWIKWRPNDTNQYIYVSLEGTPEVTDEMVSLDTIKLYTATNLRTPVSSEEGANEFANTGEGTFYWGVYFGDYEVTENSLYYSKITPPVSGSFLISVAFD